VSKPLTTITMKYYLFVLASLLVCAASSSAQVKWKNVDTLFQPLPPNVHVYYTNDSLDGKPNIAYYVEAKLSDKQLEFTTDTTAGRRLTPMQFYAKDAQPLVVVNCTFFEFVHNSNQNLVVKDGRLLSFNKATVAGRGADTFTYRHILPSAIGINKKRKADVAWTYTDPTLRYPYAIQTSTAVVKDSVAGYSFQQASHSARLKKWKMQTAVGGGPVLLQDGKVMITNNEELKFAGKAINDKHPRTAMGYTGDGRLIILVVQGRFAGIAEGATLQQEAVMLQSTGCKEALNLDGGGSSCLLINGKETIKPSDKEGERLVPAVFMIRSKQ
jgi:exopolysaccharide biosynthesis protein